MRRAKKLAAVFLSAALMITSLQLPCCRKEAEAASFKDLNAAKITEAMGAGWNLGNQMEAVNSWSGPVAFPEETAWGNPKVTKELIAAVRKAGFKSVRIPVSYLTKIASKSEGYQIEKAWLDRLEEIVGYVTANGMYAIINMHGDGYSTVKGGWLLPGKSDDAQEEIKEKYRACWEQIAERFKDQNEKLIFESMNEVGADANTNSKSEVKAYYKNINEYNQIFVDTVRQSGGNNDRRWLLIPGINTNPELTTEEAGFVIPSDDYRSDSILEEEQRIMVSVHYYTPWDFCGIEDYSVTQWGAEAEEMSKSATEGLEDAMEEQFKKLKTEFVDQGYPVVIGEYGCVDKSQVKPEDVSSGKFDIEDADKYNNTYRAYYAEVLNILSDRFGCIPVYWDNGYNGAFGLGLFDRSTYAVTQPEIIKAIMKTYKSNSSSVTGISLDRTLLPMCLGDENEQLTASLTPSRVSATVVWASANTAVATVSQRGKVSAKGLGTTVITASVNGKQAYCIVHVRPAERFRARLFYNSVASGYNYATINSNDYAMVDSTQGGTYTLRLEGTRERMSHINTLYLKDTLGNTGQTDHSLIRKATVTVDSLKLNDFTCSLSKNPFYYDASELDGNGNPKDFFDIGLINVWDESHVNEFEMPKAGSAGHFPDSAYVDGTNTITLTFTLSDIELRDEKVEEVEPVSVELSQKSLSLEGGQTEKLTARLAPEDTTYGPVWLSDDPAVAAVSLDGTVKGISDGTTTIHVFTGNGLEQTCTVSVLDLKELKAMVSIAEKAERSEYTESSYRKMETALEEAQALLQSGPADIDEKNRVQTALEDALDHLIKAETYTRLENLLAETESLKQEDYTESSWATYQQQAEAAEGVWSAGGYVQDDLENAVKGLGEARTRLLTRKTQAAMAEAIQGAKALKAADYTVSTWQVLEDALKKAEEAAADNTVGEEVMKSLLEELQTAASGLKKIDDGKTPSATAPAAAPPSGTQVPEQPSVPSGIQKKKVTLGKVRSPKKKTVQVNWKKVEGAQGYEICLGTDKKIKKGRKKVTVKKAAATKATVKKLKPGKKYYVKVRAYQTVSGRKQYSKWSTVKSVKVKR
ncbi:MAG: cellulase family glycosylhydrolase [Lachnospiraceae bacterium]|nr:cellulase family glycosylhydrolase [Lachnospiraceae bacterium]